MIEREILRDMLSVLGKSVRDQHTVAQMHHWIFGMMLAAIKFRSITNDAIDIERASSRLYHHSKHRLERYHG